MSTSSATWPTSKHDGALVPGVAPAAMQAGPARRPEHHPHACAASLDVPFRYRDKGMLATIGRGAAVAKIGPIKASGYFAWLLWLFVHIFFLIGFRNRLVVMIQWAWSYVTFDRGARLITEPLKEPLVESHADATSAASNQDKMQRSSKSGKPDLS